ncbi:terminase TerL endonuclease subunit [uncultured Bosea sp.]|uniref:terminase large subunit n=1 Tax=uncultured Bosea sp. TaxID=211457 RepID=UPI00263B4CC3|nr:terminase TerL endonuclease subunit [uncultured Bosea sp.]
MAILRPAWVDDASPIPDPLGFGEMAVQWLRQNRHPKNRAPGSPFHLDEWQERIIRYLFGNVDPVTGRRLFNRLILQVPRGNRKTSLAAAIVLLLTFGPFKVPGTLVQSAASTRKQARECFEEVALIIGMDRRYDKIASIQDYKSRISHRKLRTRYEAISSDALSQHGSTPQAVIIDELHAWTTDKHRELYKTMASALGKLSDSLMVVLTTAGRGHECLAYEVIDYARKVQRGEIHDPHLLPVIFEVTADVDWRDETAWHAVNPGLKHGYPSLDYMRKLALKAEHSPVEREVLQQLYMNVWLGVSNAPLFDMGVYDTGSFPLDLTELEALPCFVGVDMALNGDLAAVVAAWRHGDGRITVAPWFFVPSEELRLRSQRDGVPYERWRDEGHVIVTDGPIIDHAVVESHIRELCAQFDVREIAFDPNLARVTMQRLHDDDLPVVEMRQNIMTMGVAAGTLERFVNGRLLRHGGHPVLRHHFDSVVASRNDTGLVRMHKGKKTDRIDGAVAAAMAVARAAANDDTSDYFARDDHEAEMDRLWNEAA